MAKQAVDRRVAGVVVPSLRSSTVGVSHGGISYVHACRSSNAYHGHLNALL